LFDSVAQLLIELADASPVVVVIDDLHWADDASAELLEFVARHVHQAAVLLIGAYRDFDGPPQLGHLTAFGEHLVLGGLDDEAVGELIAQVADSKPSGEVAARMRTRTGGNPLFIRELTRLLQARGELFDTNADTAGPILHRDGDTWEVSFGGQRSHLPDLKGLHDLAALVAHPGQSIHSAQLLGGGELITPLGADCILDQRAKAAYHRRLIDLDAEIDEATDNCDADRAERARFEREALVDELAHAAGLGGRDRRLGDETERGRKTVSSRIRDAINRIRHHQPGLADHLDSAVSTGTWCCYAPPKYS
jgi:hypothetical protein